MSGRIIYVVRGDKYQSIKQEELAINEPFILCEADGTPVGHYIAASATFKVCGANAIRVIEIKP